MNDKTEDKPSEATAEDDKKSSPKRTGSNGQSKKFKRRGVEKRG